MKQHASRISLDPIGQKAKELKAKHEHKGGKPKTPEFTYCDDCFDPAELREMFKFINKYHP
ncbi:MAG: hypothetical protein Q8940_07325 [Bacteroidota bacterium]|nr:hypothetical protein [Bacteroidota bacterium]